MSAGDREISSSEQEVRLLLEAMRIRYNCAADIAQLKWLLFGDKTPGHRPQKPQDQRSRGGPLP